MSALTDLMAEDLGAGRPPDGTDQLVDAIVERHGASVLAILLYGSCRRLNDASEGLVDLLVVVDRYRPALGSSIGALFNTILPPNVYYLQIEQNELTLRCKYAVVSLGQFRRRARSRSDHYFWARFCQPARLAHGDAQICQQLAAIRARASIEFSRRIAPMITGTVSSESFWIQALQTTYRCELRPEPPDPHLVHVVQHLLHPVVFPRAEVLHQTHPLQRGRLTALHSLSPRRSSSWLAASTRSSACCPESQKAYSASPWSKSIRGV